MTKEIKEGDKFTFGSYSCLTYLRRNNKYIIASSRKKEVKIYHKIFELYAHKKVDT